MDLTLNVLSLAVQLIVFVLAARLLIQSGMAVTIFLGAATLLMAVWRGILIWQSGLSGHVDTGQSSLSLLISLTLLGAVVSMHRHLRQRSSRERLVQANEEKYRELVESASSAIVRADTAGLITFVNEYAQTLFGRSEQELVGQSLSVLLPQSSNSKNPAEVIAEISEHPEKYQAAVSEMVKEDGQPAWVAWTSRILRDEDGRPEQILSVGVDVTRLHQTEAALRESQEKYRTLVENANSVILRINRHGVLTFCNEYGLSLFGFSEPELIGKNVLETIVPSTGFDGHNLHQMINDLIERPKEFSSNENENCTKDGRRLWIAWTNRVIVNPQGEREVLSVGLDVTARKQAEELLHRREQEFKALSENSPDVILRYDRQLRIMYSNPNIERVVGLPREAVLGKTADELHMPKGISAAVEQCLEKVFMTGRHGVEEFNVETPTGWRTYQTRVAPEFSADGSIESVLATSRDITDRKRIEEALAGEKELLAVTLRSIGDAVIATDREGRITLINRIASELTGWGEEQAVGRQLTEVFNIINEQNRQSLDDPFQKVLDSSGIVGLSNHAVLVSRDGRQIAISDSGAPIRDRRSDVIGVVLVFRDITQQQKMESELLNAKKLESIGLLAGGIAHDFNNILTAILGSIALARMESDPQSKLYQLLEQAESASYDARNLTQQLLTFSKGGAPIKTIASIPRLLRDSVTFALRGTTVKPVFDIKPDLLAMEIDIGQIGQVINNLVINAQQAMPNGGTLRVRAENVFVTSDHGLPLADGPYVKISIQDEGIGISKENLTRIFDPYFTTKQKGSGLGLATSYAIVHKHDGYITAESELGVGTTIYLYLPAVEEKAPELHQRVLHKSDLRGSGRILLMDDEEGVRRVGCAILQHLGYQVQTAKTGEEAIEMYAAAKAEMAPFDAIIMDLTIPGAMGGKEAIEKLQQIDPQVTAIVSSGYASDPIMSNYRDYGFHGIVAKPYRIEDMGEMLQRVLAEKEEHSYRSGA